MAAVETAERLRLAVSGVTATDDLIRAADSTLSQAKERGRNQVVVASDGVRS